MRVISTIPPICFLSPWPHFKKLNRLLLKLWFRFEITRYMCKSTRNLNPLMPRVFCVCEISGQLVLQTYTLSKYLFKPIAECVSSSSSKMLNAFYDEQNYLLRTVVCIPMGTNCVPLVADLYLYYYEMK